MSAATEGYANSLNMRDLALVCLKSLERDHQEECLPGSSIEQLVGKISMEAGLLSLTRTNSALLAGSCGAS